MVPNTAFDGARSTRLRVRVLGDNGQWVNTLAFDDEGNRCVANHYYAQAAAGGSYSSQPAIECSEHGNNGVSRREITSYRR